MNEILQSVPFAVVLLVIGFVFLVKGADAFVEGCSSVAKRFHVPTLIIGMTIVAMGTSLPETAVSITASISGCSGRQQRRGFQHFQSDGCCGCLCSADAASGSGGNLKA